MIGFKVCPLGLVLALMGCAAQPGTVPVANASAQKTQCNNQEVTGSMLHKTVCTDPNDKAAQRSVDEARSQVNAQGSR